MTASARGWWRDVDPRVWRVFGQSEDLSRERSTALLAALEELSTRAPMSTLAEIATQLASVGFHDPLPEPDLRATLDQLREHRLVEPFRDYAAMNYGFDAVRLRQEAWALTQNGRTVVGAVRAAVLDGSRALQLPRRLLDGVEATVRALLEQHADDQGLLPGTLNDVRSRIDELQRVVADFYAALARMVQSDVTDDTLFGENRDRVIEALRQFPREYSRSLPRVEAALADLAATGPATIVEAAAAYAGLMDASDQQNWVDERVRWLRDLAAWFDPAGSVQQLIGSATGAVHTLLVAIDRRYTALRRGSDLAADFRELAYSLQAQPSDAEARRVYAAAFGGWPALHPAVDLEEDVAYATPAASGAARHGVSVMLREHERSGNPAGRPRRVPDPTEQRSAALAAAAAAAVERRRLAQLLVTPGEVGLGHFAGLQPAAAAALLGALESALVVAHSHPLGLGEAPAESASVLVRVRPGAPGAWVRVRLAEGELSGPDLRVTVLPATDAGRDQRATPPRGAT